MAIQLVGTPTQAVNTASLTLTIAKPAGPLVNGDYLIAHLRGQNSNSPSDWTLAGWSRAPIPAFVGSNSARVTTFLYHLVTDASSEPANYTFGTLGGGPQRVAGSLFILRGVNPSVAFVGAGGVYGGAVLSNGRRVAAYAIPNPATVIFAGDTERVSPNASRPASLPSGYTEIDFVTTDTNTAVSRTTAWTGMATIATGTTVDADVNWVEANPPGANATSFAVTAIPTVAATFGQGGVFTASAALPPVAAATFGQRAVFTAMVSIPGAIPAATPTFGRQSLAFTAVVHKALPTPPSLTNEIGCTVLIDGEPINDGCVSTDPNVPTVLSGLKVQWGRTSTVDQPQAGTCTFNIVDPLVSPRLIPSLTIGRRVDVRIDTVVYAEPTLDTLPDLYPYPGPNLTASGTTESTTLIPTFWAGTTMVWANYPPLPFSDDPFAWDAVPRTFPGQDWQLSATMAFPAPFAGWNGWAAEVQPIHFDRPDGVGGTAFGPIGYLTPDSPTVDLPFVPPPGIWLGFQVRIYPTGPNWVDVPPDVTWASLPSTPWNALSTFVLSDVSILAPETGAAKSALVFSGRITDVIAKWDGTIDSYIQVIAQDWRAELANRYVGDTPWSLESLNSRAQRIVQLSGQPIKLNVDASVAGLQVSYRDVDRQPSLDLLQQLANSCGGVLWVATHLVTGQIMHIEDVNSRPAALTLSTDGTGLVHVVSSAAAIANALSISSCEIDVDPVRFVLDMTDTLSIVAIQWLDQTTDATSGVQKPTQRTVEMTSPETMAAIGARRMSVSTQLITQNDALAQATAWLARSSTLAWRIENLRWDTTGDMSSDEVNTVVQLLDGTTRNGMPIALTDLPPWSDPMTGNQDSVALYVEGGVYTYDAGSWVLDLQTSSATGSAAGDFPWQNNEPGWRWVDYDPGVSWLDLYGVTYPSV